MKGYFLYKLSWTSPEPTLADIQEKFGISDEEIDPNFGVVKLDDDIYAILISKTAFTKIEGEDIPDGPFSNPRIDHFGMEEE